MPSPFRHHWTLDPDVSFLNHGSFGACPKVVLDKQAELRELLEREPVDFFTRRYQELSDEARAVVAEFVGAEPRDLAFVTNATTGVNTVLRSLRFAPGDELLVTTHEYKACKNAIDYVAEREGAKVVVVDVPFPIASADEVVDAVVRGLTPRTKLVLVDHVTSPTGLIQPVERIARELASRGVDLLIDGAHAPGMVPLDLASLGATYYTGNCHKWLCAPKGAALLWVRRDRQALIRPLTISHGATFVGAGWSRFEVEMNWTGTQDPTPWLCVPAAIAFLRGLLPGGFAELRARNRALVLEGRALLCKGLGVEPPAPDDMIGSLVALPLPDARAVPSLSPLSNHPLCDVLFARHRIEVPTMWFPRPPRQLVRISAQIYNDLDEYRALAEALAAELRG